MPEINLIEQPLNTIVESPKEMMVLRASNS